ncbi:hypothetical protein QUB37_28785 [Microcoleus sp. AT3-A2]
MISRQISKSVIGNKRAIGLPEAEFAAVAIGDIVSALLQLDRKFRKT